MFASKYSFCSIFRDLQDPLHLRTFASWKFADFRISLHFFREFLDFEKKNAEFPSKIVNFRRDFRRILPEFREIAENYSKIKLDLILLLKWFNFGC